MPLAMNTDNRYAYFPLDLFARYRILLTSALTGGSIIKIARFELPSFTVTLKGVAEWFGFELSKLVVDECFNR
jgi:hypothetical protein